MEKIEFSNGRKIEFFIYSTLQEKIEFYIITTDRV